MLKGKRKILIIALILVIFGGLCAVYANGRIARISAISNEEALNFACIDAGLDPNEVDLEKISFEREGMSYIYDVEFSYNGVEYEYHIDPKNGRVLSKDVSGSPKNAQTDTTDNDDDSSVDPYTTDDNMNDNGVDAGAPDSIDTGGTDTADNQQVERDMIGVDQAKQIALNDVGLSASEVTFSKAKLDRENGKMIYEIEFYIYGENEYEYEIDAITGSILEYDIDEWDWDD